MFTEKTFSIPPLTGISAKTIEEHLKLYAGYVKNLNALRDKMMEYMKDPEANSYALGELWRRMSFEYNGMRNHEVYFSLFEGGPHSLADDSTLGKKFSTSRMTFDGWLEAFKKLAVSTRGIGWAVLWYDPKSDELLSSWIDEQHYGELQGCHMLLGLDMWEHAYVADYFSSGKKQYVEDFFANINWNVVEANFQAICADAQKK
jgi:Fe-Mn family superoxide dismutase